MPPERRRFAVEKPMPRWLSRRHALAPRRFPSRRIWRLLLVLVLLGAAAFAAARLDPLPPRFMGEARASDGDSLWVGRDRVRLLGLDAPELDQVCWRDDGTEWPCGRDARAAMTRILAAGHVDCLPESEDRYGRTLARCSVDGKDIAAEIVSQGLAISTEGYGAEERMARRDGLGLWSGRFTPPREWRDEGPGKDPGPGLIESVWIWFRELGTMHLT